MVGLNWLRSTPQAFDDSTSKTGSRHRGWFIFNHRRSIMANRSKGLLYVRHVLRPSQVERKEKDSLKDKKDVHQQNKL